MRRKDLIEVIENLKSSENISYDIDCLKTFAEDFCNHYESELNDICLCLEVLAPHIKCVDCANSIAKKCSSDLY